MDDWKRFLHTLRNEIALVPHRDIVNDPGWLAAMDALDPDNPLSPVVTVADAFTWFQRGLAAIRRHIPEA